MPKPEFQILRSGDAMWMYFILAVQELGLALFFLGLSATLEPLICAAALIFGICGSAQAYTFWFFRKHAFVVVSSQIVTFYRPFLGNLVFDVSDIEQIKNINDVRYQIKTLSGRRYTFVSTRSNIESLQVITGIQLRP